MDISEQVLLNTLAQLLQKDISEAGKKLKQEQKYFEVVKNEETIATEKVDVLNLLEKKILEILLIYGNFEIEFENVFIKYEDEKEVQVTEKVTTKIFNRIYLNLQEDEIQFANPIFKDIYDDLIANYLNNDIFDSENYLNNLKPEFLPVVTDIYMDDEKHQLHGWLEKKQVFVKDKFNSEVLKSLVVDVIISYREYLINKLNSEQMIEILKPEIEDKTEILSSINDYNKLKVVISRSIGRIRPSSFLLNDF
jgi:DNA primase